MGKGHPMWKPLLATAAAILLLMVFCGPVSAEMKPVNLTFASFDSGSGWYVLAQAVAQALKKGLPEGSVVDIMPYSGGAGNPKLLHQGKVDIALGFPFLTAMAVEGEEPYKEPAKELRYLVSGLDTYWYLMAVAKGVDINSYGDIKDKKFPLKLVVLPKGSAGEWMTNMVLKNAGVTFDNINSWGGRVTLTSFDNAINMMKDGQANAFGQVATPGHPAWTELSTTVSLHFLSINKERMEALMKKYGLEEATVPKDTFKGIDADLKTLGWSTGIITTDKLPDEVAYAITKTVCESKKEIMETYKGAKAFDPSKAFQSPIKLHPGAEKYFKEKGYLK